MGPVSVMIGRDEIASRVRELGAAVTKDYAESELTVVPVLKGSFIFASDLVRSIDLEGVSVDFLGVGSYGDGAGPSGVVRITDDLSRPVVGKDVLIVEDIVDTGLTLSFLIREPQSRGAKSAAVCALLHKPSCQKVPDDARCLGFTIEDKFVAGYGLDYAEKYRNLPHIGVVG